MAEVQKVIIEFDANVEGLKPGFDSLVRLGAITAKDAEEFEKANILYAERIQAIKATEAEQKKLNSTNAVAKKDVETLVDGSKKLANNIVNSGANGAVKTLASQLKEAKLQMLQFAEGTKEFNSAKQRAASLKDEIGDLNDNLNSLAGSQLENVGKAFLSASQFGISGFQGVASAQALLGDESKALQEQLLKIQALAGLSQSLNELGKFKDVYKNITDELKSTTIVQKLLGVATSATTGLMRIFGVTANTTATSFKVLRGAIISTGIGALVIGVVALIQNFATVKETIQGVINKFAPLKALIDLIVIGFDAIKKALGFDDTAIKSAQITIDALNAVTNKLEQAKERELAIRKSLSQNTLALEKEANKVLLELAQKKHEADLKLFIANAVEKGKISKDEIEKFAETEKARIDKKTELTVRDNEIDKEFRLKGLEAIKTVNEAKLSFLKKNSEEELIQKKALLKASYNLDLAQINLSGEIKTLRDAKILALDNKFNEERTKLEQDYQNAQTQREITFAQSQLVNVGSNAAEELRLKTEILVKENTIRKNNAITGSGDIYNIEQKLIADLEKLNTEYQDKLRAENVKRIIQQVQDEQQLRGNSNQLVQNEIAYQNEIADIESQAINNSLAKRQAQQQFIRKQQIAALQIQIDDEVAAEKKKVEGIKAVRNAALNGETDTVKIKEINDKARRDEEAANQESANKLIKINQDKNKAIAEDNLKLSQEQLERLNHDAEILNQFASEGINSIRLINQSKLNETTKALEAETKANDLNFKNKQITEAEYNRKKKEIEEEDRIAKNKAAQQEKKLRIFEITIATATAIVKALASEKYALAALAAVTGAIQLAVVNSQKIPEFAKGTNYAPKGWAWVGEKGPELINLKGGEQIKTHQNSLEFAKQSFNNNFDSYQDYSKMDNAPQLSNKALDILKISNTGISIDYSKLSSMIGAEVNNSLSKLPLTQFSFDKNGFNTSVQNGNSNTKFLTDRYSSK